MLASPNTTDSDVVLVLPHELEINLEFYTHDGSLKITKKGRNVGEAPDTTETIFMDCPTCHKCINIGLFAYLRTSHPVEETEGAEEEIEPDSRSLNEEVENKDSQDAEGSQIAAKVEIEDQSTQDRSDSVSLSPASDSDSSDILDEAAEAGGRTTRSRYNRLLQQRNSDDRRTPDKQTAPKITSRRTKKKARQRLTDQNENSMRDSTSDDTPLSNTIVHKSYRCVCCFAAFSFPEQFQAHKRGHSTLCRHCVPPHRLATYASLATHMYQKHSNLIPWFKRKSCPKCKKSFSKGYEGHVKKCKIRQMTLGCDSCQRCFTSQSDLELHQAIFHS